MDETNFKDLVDDEDELEKRALKEVAYGNQHSLNVLVDLLIEKGVIKEQEFKEKLDEIIYEHPDAEDVDIPDPDENL